MDWVQIGITAFTVLISSGIIQFFVNRKDKKEEDEKKDKLDELRKEFNKGLEEREMTSKNRYDEHHLSIEKMNLQHQKDYQALQEAITKLTENDSKITESLKNIASKQDVMADANVGMIHNTLIRLTDPIIERNAVTYEELDTLDSLYLPYSRLGGNGECKRRYNDVNHLEKISKEKAVELDILKKEGAK